MVNEDIEIVALFKSMQVYTMTYELHPIVQRNSGIITNPRGAGHLPTILCIYILIYLKHSFIADTKSTYLKSSWCVRI